MNPYKLALDLLRKELKKRDIEIVKQKLPAVKEVSDRVVLFEKDKFIISDIFRENIKKRINKQYSVYELLQCQRRGYYIRNLKEIKNIDKKYNIVLKKIFGRVVEQLILSIYNTVLDDEYKFANNINIKTKKFHKELGLLYPICGVIDGISYNRNVLIDIKFSDIKKDFDKYQVLLYSLLYDYEYNTDIKQCQVIYVNNNFDIDVITIERNNDNKKKYSEYLINRIKKYDNIIRKKIVPDIEKDIWCDWCEFKSECDIIKNEKHKPTVKFML